MLMNAEPSDAELLGHLLLTAKQIAEKEGLERGFRIGLRLAISYVN
jgi:hypothetical protein